MRCGETPLAALHRQGGRLLGSEGSLTTRLRALRGSPIVINVWASWCPSCQAEWPLLASASARYGRRVAFIGVDVLDPDRGQAVSWLAGHPISYPSYTSLSGTLPVTGVIDLPTTIFIDAAGNVTDRQIGRYYSQGALDEDIRHYAL